MVTLRELGRSGVYDDLEAKAARLEEKTRAAIAATDLPLCYQRVGSMGTLFFNQGPIESLDSLADVNTDLYGKFFHSMLERGVYVAPSQYEAAFLSLAHTDADVDHIAESAAAALKECAVGG